MKPDPRIVKPVLIVVVLAAVAVAAWLLAPRLLHDGPTGLIASGTVEATEAQLGFQGAGRIESLAAREGEAIKAGAELARLDRSEMLARREHALAQVAATQATLHELQSGFRGEEVAQGSAVLAAAAERLADTKRDVERAQRLVEGGAVGAESLDKARLAFDVASSQHEQARQQLRILQTGTRREKIDVQRAQVAQAEAAVKPIDAALAQMLIHAPFGGIVTVRHREPGETVAPGAPVFTLMNPDDRWVRIYVPENRIGRLRLGGKAAISTDSFPDRTYAGQVVFIASAAEFTPKTVQTAEERVKLVYAVRVRVAGDAALELKPGMPADVRLDEADQ
ncbi:MAG TPA: efflux RND transporter periplasmic adaptor subunit [Burkholderiaceae bacterium]|nr:efflux RND transporter periplasmic adaptor subunit [Burkholderiaceae bacterium]